MILDQAKTYVAAAAILSLSVLATYQAFKVKGLEADVTEAEAALEVLQAKLEVSNALIASQTVTDIATTKELRDEAEQAKQDLAARADKLAGSLRTSPKLHCPAAVPAPGAASEPDGVAPPRLPDTTPEDLASFARDAEDDAKRLSMLQVYVRRVCLRSAPLSLSLRPISTPGSQWLVGEFGQVPHVTSAAAQ